ncbi:MAG: hypothetical protein AAF517_14060, partial [Planctomycetota bacterium]
MEKKQDLSRRDFSKLSMAALGGALTGAYLVSGCTSEGGDGTKPEAGDGAGGAAANKKGHLCRGLNDCKGKGKGGKNECAGQGGCATTAKAPHNCGGNNDCAGQGGCKGKVGTNECKGKGGCAVPLMD